MEIRLVDREIVSSEIKSEKLIDTEALSARVKHYLKSNEIQWSRFSKLVLGVSQSRLSILLGKPKPWENLSVRVKALYERMQLWMDTKATYGNNPYATKDKSKHDAVIKGAKKEQQNVGKKRKTRSLFENSELIGTSECSSLEEERPIKSEDGIEQTLFIEVNEESGIKLLDEVKIEGDAIYGIIDKEALFYDYDEGAGIGVFQDDTEKIYKEENEESSNNNQSDYIVEVLNKCLVCDSDLDESESMTEHIYRCHMTPEGLCSVCLEGDFKDFLIHFTSHFETEAFTSKMIISDDVKEEVY